MRETNSSFKKLRKGDIVEVRPDMYDRDWTKAEVLGVRYEDIKPIYTKDGMFRRYELHVKILDRKNYSTYIFTERDVRKV